MADEDGYAGALAAQLMEALGAGASDLSALATRLNETGPAPSAGAWTPDVLAAELARIAIVPPKAVISPIVVPAYDAERARRSPGPTSPALDVESRTEFLLTYGLRNQWYVVAASAEIGETPVGLQRLGEKLVLWRDGDGCVHAVEDRCPHRGTALSIGEVHDGDLTCAYHGVRVDAYGKVVLVPGLPGCPLEGKTLIRHYPVIEHYQAIWAWSATTATPRPNRSSFPTNWFHPLGAACSTTIPCRLTTAT